MAVVAGRVATEIGGDAVRIDSPAPAAAARARVDGLLSEPLTAEAAAQIALFSDLSLQAEYTLLGSGAAEPAEDALPPVGWTVPGGPMDSLLALATGDAWAGPAEALAWLERWAAAEATLRAAALRAAEASFRTAADAQRAFYRAVAAGQRLDLTTRALSTAEIALELTRKQGGTGAASKLVQMRAELFRAELSAEHGRARLEAEIAREELAQALGLGGRAAALQLPAELPDMPPPPKLAAAEAERQALARRVDLLALRLDRNALAWSAGWTEGLRALAAPDTAPTPAAGQADAPDAAHSDDRPEAYLAAANRLGALAGKIRSEVRQAVLRYAASHASAALYEDSIVPLGQSIEEESLLEYNGMLVEVYDLLAAARESVRLRIAAVDAKRDAFIAEVDLRAALIGGGRGGAAPSSSGTPAISEAAGGH